MRRLLRPAPVESRGELAALAAITFVLSVGAGVGMAYVGGFDAVRVHLEHARWWWFIASFVSILIAFGGYFIAYRDLYLAEGGPRLHWRELLAVVTAGFGGLLARGGVQLDQHAFRAGGASQREAHVRVAALTGFEHGVLGMIGCPAAVAALAAGLTFPRPDFAWPWAIAPPVGFALAFWAAERYRERLRGRGGWRERTSIFLDSVHLVRELIRRPHESHFAVLGMALYWGGDMFALWAATTAFGFEMNAPAVIIGLATGMIVTRRTAPVGGAGVLLVALVPTMWNCSGVPFSIATLGVFAYRFFTIWTPLPASFAVLPTLRTLLERQEEETEQSPSAAA